MIYVFPVSTTDAHLIDPLCDVIGHLGGMKGRKCYVVSDPQAASHAGHLYERLVKLDAKATLHTFPSNCEGGWPLACNRYFFHTVGYLTYKEKVQEPYYYFELDNTPIRNDWIERLGAEWGTASSQRRRFMGVLRDYFGKNSQGQLVSHGKIMNGSGVYPANFGAVSPLFRSILKNALPWDVFMRWEICGNPKNPNVHDISQYVTLNWSTENYRRENGEIVCDVKPRPAGMITTNKVYPITDQTIIVHGDKSSSLARLIISETATSGAMTASAPQAAQVMAKAVPAPGKYGIVPQPTAPPDQVRSLIAELLAADGKLPDGVETPSDKPKVESKATVISAKKKAPKSKKKARKKRIFTPEQRKEASARMKKLYTDGKITRKIKIAA